MTISPNAPPFLLIGHRGARAMAPENTLPGLERGLADGAKAVEFDVQLHPSGELFLLHDLTVERTTNGRGLAARLDWDSIRRLDASTGHTGFGAVGIPTLDEALDLLAPHADVLVNVEVKTWHGTARAIAACLQQRLAAGWSPARFLVSSFHWPELAAFRQAAPSIPTATLVCGVPPDWAAGAEALGVRAFNVSAEFADEALVQDARRRGLPVYAYTVNDANEARYLRGIGVAGIFTDDPGRLRTELAESAAIAASLSEGSGLAGYQGPALTSQTVRQQLHTRFSKTPHD